MAQSPAVDKAVVDAMVAEVTNVLTFGGKLSISLNLDGFQATMSVEAIVSPDVPVLSADKSAA